VSRRLTVDVATGLEPSEATTRLTTYGANRFTSARGESLWETIVEEAREPMILLLLGTAVLYGVLGNLEDALTIFAIIVVVLGVEIVNERRAAGALAALTRLAEPTTLVVRAGQAQQIPLEQVVPGDLLLLRAGKRVPADGRLVESVGLAADQSALTGESVPVERWADAVLAEATPLAERSTMVYAGTVVTRGRGTAVVVATGARTELGRVAELAAAIREPRTPLQLTMRELTRWLVWLALGLSVLIPLLGWLLVHQPVQQMILTGLAMAFATIPEELPILITIVLALGAYRLARQHAIVKRLRAAETLSAVTVIATDKTGTLTENQMAVSQLAPAGRRRQLLALSVLCSEALAEGERFVGDPLEVALLRAAQAAGLDIQAQREQYPLLEEFGFDAERQRMSVVLSREGARWVVVKGAPEAVLACATAAYSEEGEAAQPLTEREHRILLRAADAMTSEGLRVLALAEKRLPANVAPQVLSRDEVESALSFVGWVGLADPPRPEVGPALATVRKAGIRVIMVTGDHPLTARAVGSAIGLDGRRQLVTGLELDQLSDAALDAAVETATIFARTTPEHKLRIVRALRGQGERVAVTGDGINDAPALAAADIGIAMGETGTDVAREAAGIVLADDNFATIGRAVQEGRLLFANLTKAIRFYLACKVALISAMLLPVLLLLPVPFSPVQIIVTELFMDVAASATFVSERAEADLMRRPPRNPHEPFMNHRMIGSILGAAAGLFAAVTGVYLLTWYHGASVNEARTVAFVTWLLGHVLLALNLRSEREPLVRLGLFSNRLLLVWLGAAVTFAFLVVFVPLLHPLFGTTRLSPGEWGVAVTAALLGSFWLEGRKFVGHLLRTGRHGSSVT
jgi:P-type Ca2+ transporter type 2C